jgi:hypothetical protein
MIRASDVPHYEYTLSDIHEIFDVPDPRPDWLKVSTRD